MPLSVVDIAPPGPLIEVGVRMFDLKVVETALATPGVDVLVGQDLLNLTLVYNGSIGKLVQMY